MRALILIVAVMLGACSRGEGDKGAFSLVAETQVLSVFKMVETVQGVRLSEKDGFARTLAELKGEGYSAGRQFDELVAAQVQGKPWRGYFFRDLTRDEHTSSSGTTRFGLAAVPENPGSGISYLLLIDLAKMQINPETQISNGIGGELYKSATAPDPGQHWPNASELAGWEAIRRMSPQEGLQAAQELKQKYDEGRQ